MKTFWLTSISGAAVLTATGLMGEPVKAATNIDTAQPYYNSSGLGTTVNPYFVGGTLRVDQTNASYSDDFNVDASTTNSIDAHGETTTFTGNFTADVTGVLPELNLTDSAAGDLGLIQASGIWGATAAPINITNHTNFSILAGGVFNGTINQTTLDGRVYNAGTINGAVNAGVLENSGVVNSSSGSFNGGQFYNNAGGRFNVVAGASLNGGGVAFFRNAAGATVDIAGSLDTLTGFENHGTLQIEVAGRAQFQVLTNDGTIINQGTLFSSKDLYLVGALNSNSGNWHAMDTQILATGTLVNTGTITGGVINAGTFTTSGSVDFLNNTGSVNASGSISNIDNRSAGTLNVIGELLTTGTFSNEGTVNIGGGTTLTGSWSNTGTVYDAGGIAGAVTNLSGGQFIFTGGATETQSGSFDNQSGATLTVAGTLTVNGTVGGAGAITVQSGGLLTVATGGVLSGQVSNNGNVFNAGTLDTIFGGVLENTGMVNASSAALNVNTIYNEAGGVFNVLAGATLTEGGASSFANQTGAKLDVSGIFATIGGFSNAGLFIVESGGSVDIELLSNIGTIVNGGTFLSGHGVNLNGPDNINSGQWTADTLLLPGATLVNTGTLSGGVHNAGTFTTSGTVNDGLTNSGTVNASGVVTGALNVAGGTFNVTGALAASDGFTNYGTLTIASGAALVGAVTNSGTLNAAGQINGAVTNSGTVNAGGLFTGISSFTNMADATVNVGTATVVGSMGVVDLRNSGTLNLQNGQTGDRITASGIYAGAGGALLKMDVNLGTGQSDRLTAELLTGPTTLSLQGVGAARPWLSSPILLVAGRGDATFTAATDTQTQGLLSSGCPASA